MTAPRTKIVDELRSLMERRSDDVHTQVGCVITDDEGNILATGANTFTRGIRPVPTDDRLEQPEKYDWIEHAERNAIYSAARRGVALAGTEMNIPGFPCVECARAIAQSGISVLHCGSTKGWDEQRYKFTKAREILLRAGVKLLQREQ